MIILRKKSFSEEEMPEKKSHTGLKIGAGLTALGTTAAVLATKGKLGGGAQKFMGNTIGKVGQLAGSSKVAGYGAKTAATGRITEVNSQLAKINKAPLNDAAITKINNRANARFAVPQA